MFMLTMIYFEDDSRNRTVVRLYEVLNCPIVQIHDEVYSTYYNRSEANRLGRIEVLTGLRDRTRSKWGVCWILQPNTRTLLRWSCRGCFIAAFCKCCFPLFKFYYIVLKPLDDLAA